MAARRKLLLALANLLIPVAVMVFATGFFPYKPFMPGLAQYGDLGWTKEMGWPGGSVADAPFDRLVFMVVDALRSDFVFGEGSGMGFVQRSVSVCVCARARARGGSLRCATTWDGRRLNSARTV